MKKITIILKPTAECNFRCKYCYHADTHYPKGKMSIQLFEEIIQKAFSSYNNIQLIFHGGEPLLMGYEFFVEAMEIINKYKKDNIELKMGVQTNGFLLDEKFCKLFKDNGIIPAISFDGPNELNCLRDRTKEVSERIVSLREKGYKINLLGVITKENINKMDEYYKFAKKNNCHLKINPVFESGGAKEENSYMISASEYLEFLKRDFPKWLKDETALNNCDPFFGLIMMALTNRGKDCSHCGCLSKWISIHHDGSLYPCGRSYSEEYCLGNIQNIETLSQAFESENFVSLLKKAIERREYCANNCEYYSYCQGGCNNDAILAGDLSKPAEFNCQVIREIIPYLQNYVKEHQDEITNPQVKELMKVINYV